MKNKKYSLKKSFVNFLRKNRRDKEISKMFGIDKGTISRILNNKREPSKDFILKVCKKFRLYPNDFLKSHKKGGE